MARGFTPDVRDAWVTVYGVLANTMQAGAKAGRMGEVAACSVHTGSS